MLRSEMIEQLTEENPHQKGRDVETVVDTVFDVISKALADGDRVELRGFGAFSVKDRAARLARNPRTGESVEVPATKHVFFRAGREIARRLNQD